MSLPSDRYVLQTIYNLYKDTYPGPENAQGRLGSDPYVEIDIQAIAARLNCRPELLFGRLYYHLDKKHRYQQDSGVFVPLFELKVGKKRHAVNFPYLAAILAGENRDLIRFIVPLAVSGVALVVSIIALVAGIVLRNGG